MFSGQQEETHTDCLHWIGGVRHTEEGRGPGPGDGVETEGGVAGGVGGEEETVLLGQEEECITSVGAAQHTAQLLALLTLGDGNVSHHELLLHIFSRLYGIYLRREVVEYLLVDLS